MNFTADFAVDRSSRVLVLIANFPFYGKMNFEACALEGFSRATLFDEQLSQWLVKWLIVGKET